MRFCPDCGAENEPGFRMCGACGMPAGRQATTVRVEKPVRYFSPGVAFLLTIIPGAGHLYKGEVVQGILWFLFTSVGYAMFILPGVVLHFLCALHAMQADAVEV